MPSCSQQKTLFPQTSEQGNSLQQAPPAAAHKNVPAKGFIPQTTSAMKLFKVGERKRKRHPHGRQEFPVNVINLCVQVAFDISSR